MKKILSVSAVCLAGLIILLLLLFTVFQLVMSGRENWPSFSFGTFMSGEYFARIGAYYKNTPSEDDPDGNPYGDPEGNPDGEETKTNTETETEKDTAKNTETDPVTPETEQVTEVYSPVFFALSQTEISVAAGVDVYIGAAAYPGDGIDDSLYTAEVSNTDVAMAAANGAAITVSGVGVGDAIITVYYDGTGIGTVSVTVTEGSAESEPTDNDPKDTEPPQEIIESPYEIDPNRPMLALTFDDGPSKHTEKLLDVLKEYNSRATFFMIGKQVSAKKSTLVRMVEEGHDLGVHTWNHKNLKTLTIEEVRYEVSSVRDKVEELTGVRPTLVRPPYGAVNDTVKEVSRLDEFYIINWNIDTLDWQLRDAELIHNTVMEQAKDGAIILLHDLHKETVEAMLTAIPALIAEGYQLVTVTELLSFSDEEPEFGETIRRQ